MIKHKSYVEIESHVTELTIGGWENYKSERHVGSRLIIRGTADKRKFYVETTGRNTLAQIVNKIVKQVTK